MLSRAVFSAADGVHWAYSRRKERSQSSGSGRSDDCLLAVAHCPCTSLSARPRGEQRHLSPDAASSPFQPPDSFADGSWLDISMGLAACNLGYDGRAGNFHRQFLHCATQHPSHDPPLQPFSCVDLDYFNTSGTTPCRWPTKHPLGHWCLVQPLRCQHHKETGLRSRGSRTGSTSIKNGTTHAGHGNEWRRANLQRHNPYSSSTPNPRWTKWRKHGLSRHRR